MTCDPLVPNGNRGVATGSDSLSPACIPATPGRIVDRTDAFNGRGDKRIEADLVFSGYHFNYEEADLKGLPAALDALRSIQADHFVPGHGPSGGMELAEEQARYHRAVA